MRQQVLKCKASRAVALDGWRVSELHDLPVEFYDVVASIFSWLSLGHRGLRRACKGMLA